MSETNVNNVAPELAGRLRRLLATGIDAILVPTLTVVLIMVTDIMEDAEDYQNSLWVLWVLVLAIVSYLLLNGYGLWTRGQTIGKRLLGIAIVRSDPNSPNKATGTPASFWKLVLLRAWFFPFLFLLPVPWLTLLPIADQAFIFSKNRRCLHDRLCATSVIRLTR